MKKKLSVGSVGTSLSRLLLSTASPKEQCWLLVSSEWEARLSTSHILLWASLTTPQWDFWGLLNVMSTWSLCWGNAYSQSCFSESSTFSSIFHFKRTKCINLVPGRTCLSLCDSSSAYTGNQRAGDFNLTFPLSFKSKPRQYKRDLLRGLCSCTALILAPWRVYLLPSRKSQT